MDTKGSIAQPDPETAARLVERALGLLTGKWKVLILWRLGQAGVCRFGELQRAIPGITQRTLTLQLRELESAGLVHRTVYPEVPPRTEYRQTEAAKNLRGVYMELKRWSLEHRALLG
jgi:DNA-binding HxlR family transcriptional regulator